MEFNFDFSQLPSSAILVLSHWESFMALLDDLVYASSAGDVMTLLEDYGYLEIDYWGY